MMTVGQDLPDGQTDKSAQLGKSFAIHDLECSTDDETIGSKQDVTDSLLHKVALFLMKLETKCHIPSSTVQLIFEELKEIHDVNTDRVLKVLSVNNVDSTTTVSRSVLPNRTGPADRIELWVRMA
jgi:hypothetical protein